MTEPTPEPPMTFPHTPEQTPPPARRGVRLRTAALFTAAVLGAGAVGGLVTGTVLHDGTATSVPASVARTSATVTTVGSAAGTPESAAAAVAPSVVTLEVTGTQTTSGFDGFGGPRSQQVADTGSGVVIRSDGYILTNNHVVSAAAGGGTVTATFDDGKTAPATIVGRDATSDLAVVKVRGVSGLKAATFANSDTLRVGQAVLAVGAPLGLSNTVTEGIVSTLHRPVATGESGAGDQAVLDAIQTDAAINPGNSGGALVDLAGHVVGINSAIATTGGSSSGQSGSIGVGFAIPANDAADIADQLIASGHATHAQLGLSVSDAGGTGAGVRAVTGGGPADKAGLRAGDVVTRIDDRRVTDANSLVVAVRAHHPGATVTVTYTRGGHSATARATLGTASSA